MDISFTVLLPAFDFHAAEDALLNHGICEEIVRESQLDGAQGIETCQLSGAQVLPLKAALGTLTKALDERFDPGATRRRFTLALSEVDPTPAGGAVPNDAPAPILSFPDPQLRLEQRLIWHERNASGSRCDDVPRTGQRRHAPPLASVFGVSSERSERVLVMKPRFFAAPVQFRAWFEVHHETATEILVGFYKKGTGKPSITWPESVDEALCFGWIDGLRRSLGDKAYSIRFTPRRSRSIWSAINVARIAELTKLGKMTPAGLRAFEARTPERTGIYSFERNAAAKLTLKDHQKLRAHAAAAAFFDAQPLWYRRTAIHWVVSAKRENTRQRRLDKLIGDSAAGRTIPPLTRPDKKRAVKRARSK